VRLWRYSFTQNCYEEPHASLAEENKHDAELTEANANERHKLVNCALTITSTPEIGSCTCKTCYMLARAARSFLESLESQQELGQLGHLDCTNIAVR